MTTAILELRNIQVAFSGNRVLEGVNLQLTRGFNGLIGPNGAGKTTAFNVISGYVKPNKGEVLLDGKDISKLSQAKVTKAGVGRTFQSPRLVPDITVLENVLLGRHHLYKWGHVAELFHWPAAVREEKSARRYCVDVLAEFGLADQAHLKTQSLALGSQKLLEVVRALVGQPRALLLDEPAAGLGAEDARTMLRGLRRFSQDFEMAVVIIEHDLELVSALCQRVSVLDYGKIIAHGTPEEVTNDKAVVEAYLGTGFVSEVEKAPA